jgi:hypothetical protein
MIKTLHPDSAAVDRVGTRAIREHFGITRQSIAYWREKGVPKHFRKPLKLFAESKGVQLPEMSQMRDRESA